MNLVCVCVSEERLNFRADRVAALCCKSYAEGGLETLRGYLQIEQMDNK